MRERSNCSGDRNPKEGRSPLGGGLPVHITAVRRLPDGRVTSQIGYEYH